MQKTKFGREITVVLLIKVILLYGLWWVCFKPNKAKLTSETFATKIYAVKDAHAE